MPWYQNIDVGKLNGVVILDLKKALVTVLTQVLFDRSNAILPGRGALNLDHYV